ncbi:MAG: hypothetical protein Q8888_01765 [Vigna little leaf phytoplasma]|nr:hypothetical protein [Vigna little leaf phytoplasma]
MALNDKLIDDIIKRINLKHSGRASMFINGSDERLRKFYMINFSSIFLECKYYFFDCYDRPYNILHNYQGQEAIIFQDYIPDLTSILFMIKMSIFLHKKKESKFPYIEHINKYIRQNKNYHFENYDFRKLKFLCILTKMDSMEYLVESIVKKSGFLAKELFDEIGLEENKFEIFFFNLVMCTASAFPNYHHIIDKQNVDDYRFNHDINHYVKKYSRKHDLEAIAKDYEQNIKENNCKWFN